MTTLYRSYNHLLIVFCLALTSCSITQGPDQPEQPQAQTADAWLQLAETAKPPQQAQYRLNAATLLYQQGDPKAAENALSGIAPKYLQGSAIADYIALRARLQSLRQGPDAALAWIQSERPRTAMNSLQPGERVSAYEALADLHQAAGNHLEAARTRNTLNPLLADETQRIDNQERLWASLLELTPDTLAQQRAVESNSEFKGWLDLALIVVGGHGDLEQQQTNLAQWQRSWPAHPAQLHPPASIALLQEMRDSPSVRMAVLLPLSGRLQNAGIALRDGIMLAYLDAQARGAQPASVAFYDTASSNNIQQLYQEAVAQGAEMVIGPLSKQKVMRLSRLQELPVPVLALNYLDDNVPDASTETQDIEQRSKFFQFGLSSADDAREAARRAWSLNYRRAFLLHAYDSQSKRTAESFELAWSELEGETAVTVAFDNEQAASSEISKALQIPLSEQRAQKLQAVLGRQLQSTPRRRQDIDFVYLPVTAQQARSLKPLLAYHFAQDLPVLSSSRVYTGRLDERSDSDLNGVYFTETPWVLDAMPALSTRIDRHIEAGAPNSKNLYALGMDAYQLAPRVSLMAQAATAKHNGLTGILSVNKRGIVLRVPSWAVFRNGAARALQPESI